MTASGYRMYSKASRDSQYELIERYAPLVKRIAYHLLARLPASVQVDDLIQAGMIGLLEVSGKYDATKGASFETYAGIRIRGAMLDEVRKGDWAPRSVHRNTRMVSDAIRVIEAKTGCDAKDHEVAAACSVSTTCCRTANTKGCMRMAQVLTRSRPAIWKTNASRARWPMRLPICPSVSGWCWRCTTTKN